MKKIASCLTCLWLILPHASGGVFFKEGFESYDLDGSVVGEKGSSGNWGVWPAGVNDCQKVIAGGSSGGQVLQIFNESGDAVYMRTPGSRPSSEWSKAVEKAETVYAQFSFVVPEDAQDQTGVLASFYFSQKGNDQATGAFLAIANDPKKSGQVILASNGPGDGMVEWQVVGRWEFGKWATVGVEQRFAERKYDVRVDNAPAAKSLNFRNASSWLGDTWGESAEFKFSISQGARLNLDSVVFSTAPIKP